MTDRSLIYAAGLLRGLAAGLIPLAAGATLKIVYDLLMWRAFSGLKPPEEAIQRPL